MPGAAPPLSRCLLLCAATLIASVAQGAAPATATAPTPASASATASAPRHHGAPFVAGRYAVQSPLQYAEPARSSRHVTVRDGTRLAISIYRPTDAASGAVVTTPLPVVWVFTASRRATVNADGTLAPGMSDGFELVRRGYVFAVAETRGRGASFGTRRAIADLTEARDAYDITEWLATQPFSTGQIGMYGGASLGRTQLTAAHFAPPHLRALFLGFTEFDRYDGWARGGIPDNPATSYSKYVTAADDPAEDITKLQPVDGDADRSLLRAAFAEHGANVRYTDFFAALPLRDSRVPGTRNRYWLETSPSRNLAPLRSKNLAIYHAGGWYADSRRDTLLMLRNLPNPQRAIIGPWNPASAKPEREAERTAFFDRYLKGIDNGLDRDPPIAYYTVHGGGGGQWRYAKSWPLPEEKRIRWYLGDGERLATTSAATGTVATRIARYDIRSQSQFEVRGAMDLSAADRDAKSLTWTSEPLAADTEITGHPVARLWLSASAADIDVFAHLEQVAASGESTYVTDGRLRASHRRLHRAYYDTAGLPWHRGFARDLVPLRDSVPVELAFDLLPTSHVFPAGSRIRIAVSHADPSTLFLQSPAAPRVSVQQGGEHASYIELPAIGSP